MAKDPLCPLASTLKFVGQVDVNVVSEYKEHTVKKEEENKYERNYSSFSKSFDLGLKRGDSEEDQEQPSSSSGSSSYSTRSSYLTRASSTDDGSSTSSSSASPSSTSRDFSTPYSSLSTEALNRLNRLREEKKASAQQDAENLNRLAVPSSSELRRRTTDLSSITSSNNSSGLTSDNKDETSTKPPLSPSTKRKDTSGDKLNSNDSSTSSDSFTLRIKKSPCFQNESEKSTSPTRSKSPSKNTTTNSDSSTSLTPTSTTTTTAALLKSPTTASTKPKLSPVSEKTSTFSSISPKKTLETPKKSPNSSSTSTVSPTASYAKLSTANSSSSIEEPSLPTTGDPSKPKKVKRKRLLIQGVQEVVPSHSLDYDDNIPDGNECNSADVAFIIQVKSTRKKKKENDDDETMSMTTDTTETTLVDFAEREGSLMSGGFSSGVSTWEYEEVKQEVERLKDKCEKLEKEKAEFLLRRVANLETPRAQSNEFLKLQQKVNLLTTTNEDLKDEKKFLDARVQELENELAARPNVDVHKRSVNELRTKLSSAEAQVEQLTEDKRDALQQMQDMRDEFEEMQDSFREEQSEEFATVKKELDDATKNIRLLQFKLRKVEKKADQLEAEKKELENRFENSNNTEKVAKLEQELVKLKSENEKLIKATTNNGNKLGSGSISPRIKKKSPVLTKAPSGEKVDAFPQLDVDPAQLLTDLQSTLERESDMREQLKFAEEEVNTMRQKISRIEEENESLLIQIKKMSTMPKANFQKGKDSLGKVNTQVQIKEDKMESSDLKLQLELNEQESKILQRKVEDLENINNKISKELQLTEEKLHKLENSPNFTKSKSVDEVSLLRRKIIEKEREVERLESELSATKNKGKLTRGKSLEEETKKFDEIKLDLKKAQTELNKVRNESDEQRKSFDEDLNRARKDVENHQTKIIQTLDLNKKLQGDIDKFKKEMLSMKGHYEGIQDDFIIKNSQLQSQKENIEKSHLKLKKEYETIDKELRTLRETYNTKQDEWIISSLDMQEKMKEMEVNAKKIMNIPGDSETAKLKGLLKQQTREFESRFQELEVYKDQLQILRKENDDLKNKLDDYEKVVQVQMRNLQVETPKQDKEIQSLKEKLFATEKHHKNELAQLKMKNEQQAALKAEDISSIQSQLSRAKRERDTFRQMVDSAQRAIAELKSKDRNSSPGRPPISSLEEAATGARAAVISLQERVSLLEDELSDARRDTSKSNTELATEKSTFEMKIGEMQQKINELEEDRLINSGRARGAGQRTRLELAWQKEREEQQRRLKEATTLARDLKTTLQELERERDREKLETKRRLEQLKLTLEEDQEDLKRKVGDTQNDLLELRDAHAKLRTANEKLRRDRERLEKEKESQLKRELENRKVFLEREKLLDQLMNRINSVHTSSTNIPMSVAQGGGSGNAAKMNVGEILHYLKNIKDIKETEDILNPREKRRSNFRRAASAGDGDDPDLRTSQESLSSMPGGSSYGRTEHYGAAGKRVIRGYTGSASGLNLQRNRMQQSSLSTGNGNDSLGMKYKSLSLEQTLSLPDEQKIWKGESDAGSAGSLNSSIDGQYSRGSSMERMSTISSKSDKKSTSLMGKMKKLVKSKSIEEPTSTANSLVKVGVQAAGVGSSAGSAAGSDLSLNSNDGNDRSEKGESSSRRIKDKVKGIFRKRDRSGSRDRDRSVERPRINPNSNIAVVSPQNQNQLASSKTSRENTPNRDSSTQRPLISSQRPLMR